MPDLPIIIFGLLVYALLSLGLNRLAGKAAAAGDRSNPRWQIQERAVICILTCFLILIALGRNQPLIGGASALDVGWLIARAGILLGFLLLFHFGEILSEDQTGATSGQARRRMAFSFRIISPVWVAVAFFVLITQGNVLLGWLLDISLLLSFCAGVMIPALVSPESGNGASPIRRDVASGRRNSWMLLIAGVIPLQLLSLNGFAGIMEILSLSGIMFCLVALSAFPSLRKSGSVALLLVKEEALFYSLWLVEFLLLSSRLVPVRLGPILIAVALLVLLSIPIQIALIGAAGGRGAVTSVKALLRRPYGLAAAPLFVGLMLLCCPAFLQPGRAPLYFVILPPVLALIAAAIRLPEYVSGRGRALAEDNLSD